MHWASESVRHVLLKVQRSGVFNRSFIIRVFVLTLAHPNRTVILISLDQAVIDREAGLGKECGRGSECRRGLRALGGADFLWTRGSLRGCKDSGVENLSFGVIESRQPLGSVSPCSSRCSDAVASKRIAVERTCWQRPDKCRTSKAN
jgi:hypothetical protein